MKGRRNDLGQRQAQTRRNPQRHAAVVTPADRDDIIGKQLHPLGSEVRRQQALAATVHVGKDHQAAADTGRRRMQAERRRIGRDETVDQMDDKVANRVHRFAVADRCLQPWRAQLVNAAVLAQRDPLAAPEFAGGKHRDPVWPSPQDPPDQRAQFAAL